MIPGTAAGNHSGDIFATTHWSVVLAAKSKTDPGARAALEELCRTYWFPLYAYVRRRGHTREEAEDLTQEFFRRFLAGESLDRINSERGRFRAYLLAALKNFLANEWDKSQRKKRGGGVSPLSLDWSSADCQFQVACADTLSPDQAFDREWALALLERVMERLREEWQAENKEAQFEELKGFLSASGGASYAEISQRLGMPEAGLRVAVHRLRKRYRALLRAEIAGTLSNPSLVQEEIRSLFQAFDPT